MANIHYARIGDIWKHLPLAEILAIERPTDYWESHAGSAWYSLTHSPERNYGVYYFVEHADKSPTLRSSAYWKHLGDLQTQQADPRYPGSPTIAMSLLPPDRARCVFCDFDGESLSTIADTAQRLGIPNSHVNCVEGDGVSTLLRIADDLPSKEASGTFAHIDPYEPFDESGPAKLTPMDLFSQLSSRGFKTMLWYGFDSHEHRSRCHDEITKSLVSHEVDHVENQLWCGEIVLSIIDRDCHFDPGVRGGCGILTANLSAEATSASSQLGKGLEQIYQTATLPTGESGSLHFVEIDRWTSQQAHGA